MIYLYIILLVIISCDTPSTYQCLNNQIMDDCGNCRECESEECNWNDAIDECGECNGNGPSISCSCSNEELVCSISECNDYNLQTWIIDLQFLTEEFTGEGYCISETNNSDWNEICAGYTNENTCHFFYDDYECSWIGTFEIDTNAPIYWNNSSNQDITIYTENTQGDYCDNTVQSGVEADCNQYDNEIACENSLCEWVLSPTYNPFWDTYTVTVPQGTIGVSQFFFIQYEFSNCGAFLSQTEEKFCLLQIDGLPEKCGIIKVVD